MFPTRSQARPSVKSMTAPAARRRVRQSQWLKVTRSSRPDRITSPPRSGAPIGGSQHRLCHREWRALPRPPCRGASKPCRPRRGATRRVLGVCYGACVTTARKPARRRRGGTRRAPVAAPLDLPLEEPAASPPADTTPDTTPAELVATFDPEPAFAARIPPPEPERPRPSVRRAIFFDVENSSRADHVARVLAHLDVDRMTRTTDLCAVGNWRVVNHDTARLLAERGAHLVHSAPSAGVRDWSDLRIAVAAGVWLAAARPGDLLEIVTDDQAFDAVGDVATSLGVGFHRLSYRALAGAGVEPPQEAAKVGEPRGRRRRRGGRRGRREGAAPAPSLPISPAANGGEPAGEAHTAPHDELLAVARELLAGAPERTVSIDALSNALKARGFRRTPGSPRLITRLRRIKELEVGRTGAIRLVEPGPADEAAERSAGEPEATPGTEDAAAPTPGKRRRRRRGGRRRRGRGSGPAVVDSP